MREDLKRSFQGKTLINIAFSVALSVVVSYILVRNMDAVQAFLEEMGGPSGVITPINSLPVGVMLIVLIGIGIFSLCFILFQSSQISYIRDIVQAMKEISKGDLTVKAPVLGDDELAYMAAALNNMTEDIRVLIERERAAEKSKNELITNVAHDLRTPLTSILGYLELLSNNSALEQDIQQQYTKIAYDKAKRLQNLIEDLFGFTKMTYGKLSVQITSIDIVQLIEQLIDEFYPVFEEKELECEYQTDTSALVIQADGNLIARLFENLLNNAAKYGADGKLVRITLTHDRGLVIVTVTNYGFVIPQEEIGMIFEKFYRVERSRSTHTGGTGLGLAIVKTIAELHGGSVDVESSLENGTVFTVRLRIAGPSEKESFVGKNAAMDEMMNAEEKG